MRRRYAIVFSLAGSIVALDQLSKLWVSLSVPLNTGREIIPGFFDLVHVLNRGSAFGFLNRPDITWQRYFFIAASFAAIGVILHMVRSAEVQNRLFFAGLGCILGGAAGNLIDRLRFGQVVDFLDFYWQTFHWPAFNVADSAITVGAFALLFSFYAARDRSETASGKRHD